MPGALFAVIFSAPCFAAAVALWIIARPKHRKIKMDWTVAMRKLNGFPPMSPRRLWIEGWLP